MITILKRHILGVSFMIGDVIRNLKTRDTNIMAIDFYCPNETWSHYCRCASPVWFLSKQHNSCGLPIFFSCNACTSCTLWRF